MARAGTDYVCYMEPEPQNHKCLYFRQFDSILRQASSRPSRMQRVRM